MIGDVVYVCSPWRGDVERHERYALAAMRDALDRGEAPVVPHLLYPRVLDDEDPGQRARGMEAGVWLLQACDALVVYEDFGVSAGMRAEIEAAKRFRVPVEWRTMGVPDGA